jgi:hypothetical protein
MDETFVIGLIDGKYPVFKNKLPNKVKKEYWASVGQPSSNADHGIR